MACHLAHRIPWESICEIYLLSTSKRQLCQHEELKRVKQLQHAARCFARTLREFQASDRMAEEDREFYDPTTWDRCEFAEGGEYMDIFDSLVWGYIELNLILADPKRILPRMMPDGRCPRALRVMAGETSGAHPDEMADHLRQALDDDGRLKPLTADIVRILRDHAALMFRCMYCVREENRLLSEQGATLQFFRFFGGLPPASLA